MAVTQEAIDTYLLYHLNVDYTYGKSAVIYCYGGGSYKGKLHFHKEGTVIPASTKSSTYGTLDLRFHENQLKDMLGTLRLEEPLYIWFNDVNQWGGLTTSSEPIGEEES